MINTPLEFRFGCTSSRKYSDTSSADSVPGCNIVRKFHDIFANYLELFLLKHNYYLEIQRYSTKYIFLRNQADTNIYSSPII